MLLLILPARFATDSESMPQFIKVTSDKLDACEIKKCDSLSFTAEDAEWQAEYDLYECATKDPNEKGGCFCGFLEDQLELPRNIEQLRASAGPSACYEGAACTPNQDYPCNNIELLSLVGLDTMNGVEGVSDSTSANDIWGWADPEGTLEIAIIGLRRGTAFVNVTDPTQPISLGTLPLHNSGLSSWAGKSPAKDASAMEKANHSAIDH